MRNCSVTRASGYNDRTAARASRAKSLARSPNIAGVLNEGRNVLGLMPHPDRSSELLLGSADGLLLFQSMVQSLAVVS